MSFGARQIIRGMTALLLVAVVGGLAGLAVYRAKQKRPAQTEMAADQVLGQDGGSAVSGVYTGFKHMERVDGKMVFAIEALRTLGKSSGWNDIEIVTLRLFGDDEEKGPVLTCRNARYNADTSDAELHGSVQVEFPDGSFLATEVAGLFEGGRRFETQTNLVFVGNGLFGNAGSAKYDFSKKVLDLGRGVVVRGSDGNSLIAPKLVYNRNRGELTLPQGGRLDFGRFSLQAPSGSITLDEATGDPTSIRFKGGVEVLGSNPANDQQIHVQSAEVTAQRDAAGRWQVEASSPETWVRATILGGQDHLSQDLKTWFLRGVADAQGLVNLRAEGQVCFELVPYEGIIRQGESREARIWFEGGMARNIELDRMVELRQGEQVVRAHQVRIDSDSGMVMLRGNPVGNARVTLESKEGMLAADHVVLYRDGHQTELHGSVQGQMAEAQLVADGDKEEEPVHIAADSLTIHKDEQTYVLRKDARAWQGERLLVGDEITYAAGEQRLEAKGHVRTAFPVVMLEPETDSHDDVVLESRTMIFRELEQRAEYSGNVVLTHPTYRLKGQNLEIRFSSTNELESVIATGAVEITDIQSGQQLTGNRAVRDVVSGVVQLIGDPAQAVDQDGNMLSGKTLTWDQAGGRVSVSEDTETIYHPEDET